ncbi:hypothetical protein [Acetobacter senegalensis]|uniref:hypothetical protein n=1 Tax=Acetobacter senegalensis TaxID=446692 RepID=UPI001EDB9F83|nr:hypothetical protein [Acetobacter senegalensis]MCG4258047.1 hypothetical protein [Acetobacter senegalensis]MCG4267974.1 hypothetical protein [Acetobacter senegalensis]
MVAQIFPVQFFSQKESRYRFFLLNFQTAFQEKMKGERCASALRGRRERKDCFLWRELVLLDRIELSTSPLPKLCWPPKTAVLREGDRPKTAVLQKGIDVFSSCGRVKKTTFS